MRKSQLKDKLRMVLREPVHLKRVEESNALKPCYFTEIYAGFHISINDRIAWVSEDIPHTMYIKDILRPLSVIREMDKIILDYADTPLSQRKDKYYVVAVGENSDGSIAAYSKNSWEVQDISIHHLIQLNRFHFTQRDFLQLCDYLPKKFEKVAETCKKPLSSLNVLKGDSIW